MGLYFQKFRKKQSNLLFLEGEKSLDLGTGSDLWPRTLLKNNMCTPQIWMTISQ